MSFKLNFSIWCSLLVLQVLKSKASKENLQKISLKIMFKKMSKSNFECKVHDLKYVELEFFLIFL